MFPGGPNSVGKYVFPIVNVVLSSRVKTRAGLGCVVVAKGAAVHRNAGITAVLAETVNAAAEPATTWRILMQCCR